MGSIYAGVRELTGLFLLHDLLNIWRGARKGGFELGHEADQTEICGEKRRLGRRRENKSHRTSNAHLFGCHRKPRVAPVFHSPDCRVRPHTSIAVTIQIFIPCLRASERHFERLISLAPLSGTRSCELDKLEIRKTGPSLRLSCQYTGRPTVWILQAQQFPLVHVPVGLEYVELRSQQFICFISQVLDHRLTLSSPQQATVHQTESSYARAPLDDSIRTLFPHRHPEPGAHASLRPTTSPRLAGSLLVREGVHGIREDARLVRGRAKSPRQSRRPSQPR